jgi:hypothetical protein
MESTAYALAVRAFGRVYGFRTRTKSIFILTNIMPINLGTYGCKHMYLYFCMYI